MPSVFTTTSRGRPSRPTVINPYGIYRPALTINDRGLGNGANPAGAVNVGGNVEFDYHFILNYFRSIWNFNRFSNRNVQRRERNLYILSIGTAR